MVQIVTQKLGTSTTSMAVINTEKGTGWPSFMLSVLWLNYVQNDAYSILIVVSYQPLIRVRSIRPNYPVPLITTLRGFVVGYNDSSARCQLQFRGLLNNFGHHFVNIYDCQRFYCSRLSRLGINFVSHIHILPIFRKKILQICIWTANKTLTSTRALRSICYALLTQSSLSLLMMLLSLILSILRRGMLRRSLTVWRDGR